MIDLSQVSVAVFDCDGVILESNQLKTEGFRAALPGEPSEQVEEFVTFHKVNGGVSRYVKFEHYFREIKKLNGFEGELDQALRRYSDFVRAALLSCDEIPGIRATLESLKARSVPCAVNSGGDEAELRELFQVRGLDEYFAEILGSPKTKIDNLEILKQQGYLQGPGVYFGDAKSDLTAASEFGLDFVFVHGVSEWKDGVSYCSSREIPMIASFADLQIN